MTRFLVLAIALMAMTGQSSDRVRAEYRWVYYERCLAVGGWPKPLWCNRFWISFDPKRGRTIWW